MGKLKKVLEWLRPGLAEVSRQEADGEGLERTGQDSPQVQSLVS